VFQSFNPVPTITGRENITLQLPLAAARATGVDRRDHRYLGHR
jgi:predicted ABC-type transport system involved in lysophospholipase L1 biosynthesis ATPase subunit